MMADLPLSVDDRIRRLERLCLDGEAEKVEEAVSIEGLLDSLLVLHDECCGSTLRQEQNIANFVAKSKALCQ